MVGRPEEDGLSEGDSRAQKRGAAVEPPGHGGEIEPGLAQGYGRGHRVAVSQSKPEIGIFSQIERRYETRNLW